MATSDLYGNLKGMNQTYAEIVRLFVESGVQDFERLPEDVAVRERRPSGCVATCATIPSRSG